MRKLLFLFLLTAGVGLSGNTQTMTTDTLVVLQIAQEEGLSQLGATSLQFDENGYLWAGTQNGLNRFNGYQMKVWLADIETSGFPDDHIRAMHYQSDTLWMTTNTNALCAYLLAEGRFIHFSEQLDFENNPFIKYTYALKKATDHLLIVGAAGHCLLFDRNQQSFDILPVPQMLENDFVTCIQHLDQGLYLIGTNASGLYLLDVNTKKITESDRLKPLQNIQINTLFRQKDGRLFIGSDKGLYVATLKLDSLEQIDTAIIRSIHRWDENTLLIGGKNENFFLTKELIRHNIAFVNHEGRELASDILAFQEDYQGGKWIGTETRGIFYFHSYQTKFKSQRIQARNSPKKDFISTFNFLRDKNDLWMATEFGFVKHPLRSNEYKVYRTDFLEYTLAKDDNGIIWAGGFEQGLLRYDNLTDKFTDIVLPFRDKDIIQITPISRDSIWIHTWSSGIYALNTRTLKFDPVPLLGKEIVRSRISLRDSRGHIWIGSDEGLYVVKQDQQAIYYDSISNERVFALAEDPSGNIWVGTAKGLNRLDPVTGEINHYMQQPGLPNDFIYATEVDQKGNVWVSTNYGISMLDQWTKTFKNYTEDDGLQNNEFNGKAGYQDSLGYLYFGGMNGFNIFHPDSIPVNQHVGRTHIENVLLFGRPIAQNVLYTDTLVFSHDQNVITFDFVNLNYLWSKKNLYQFILEGFDKEWRPVTRDRSTTYTNLAPGTYTFKVRGSNNEMLWGNIDEMTIIIRSPWYATTAFRVGIGLLLLTLIAGGLTYKSYQQRKTNIRLKHMVDERTEELSETNSALQKSLELTQRQKEDISFLMQELNHRVKNNLQLITSLIDIQNFEIDDQQIQDKLRILQSRVFTVSKIHDLLNIRDKEKGVSVIGFINNLAQDLIAFSGHDILFESHIDPIVLPSNKLTYLGLILNELMTNSIKHAFREEQQHKVIYIDFEENGEVLTLQFRDNGVGFDINEKWGANHKGLNLIQMLIKELKGTVDARTDKGAIFTIILPKNQ